MWPCRDMWILHSLISNLLHSHKRRLTHNWIFHEHFSTVTYSEPKCCTYLPLLLISIFLYLACRRVSAGSGSTLAPPHAFHNQADKHRTQKHSQTTSKHIPRCFRTSYPSTHTIPQLWINNALLKLLCAHCNMSGFSAELMHIQR